MNFGKCRPPPAAARLAALLTVILCSTARPPSARAEEKIDLEKMFRDGIPPSPFAAVVYRYADAMLARGRNLHGPRESGLFFSALERQTLAPPASWPAAPRGVRRGPRPGSPGAAASAGDPVADENLLRLLLFLQGLSGEKRYRAAADRALEGWLRGGPVSLGRRRPWVLWRKCHELAPEATARLARALREGPGGGAARGSRPGAGADLDGRPPPVAARSPRRAGFRLRAFAEVYALSADELLLRAAERVLARCEVLVAACERSDGSPAGAAMPAGKAPPGGRWLASGLLSLAIDAAGAARKLPEPSRTRLVLLSRRIDRVFCSLGHDLGGRGGFARRLPPPALTPEHGASNPARAAPGSERRAARPQAAVPDAEPSLTPLWDPILGGETTARVAMMCVSRYETTGAIEYRKLVIAAAHAYLDSLPADGLDAWPGTFGQAISLELAAWRLTARPRHFRRAFRLGEIAVERFFADAPLPRASLRSEHYENTTGADTLALALAELHLMTRQITAVRAPVNTIDR